MLELGVLVVTSKESKIRHDIHREAPVVTTGPVRRG